MDFTADSYNLWEGDDVVPALSSPRSTFIRSRYQEALRNASSQNLFKSLDRQALFYGSLEQISSDENCILNPNDLLESLLNVGILSLSNVHLRAIPDIGLLMNLRICLLSKNYLSQLEPLCQLPQLVKLDVSENQIEQLPPRCMFMNLTSLRILLLHNNPLDSPANVVSLSACQSLLALTLFDTPLSIKKNYRHHVVNSILSLKALDFYVIADEEVIEDASFGYTKFKTFNDALRIDLTQNSNSGVLQVSSALTGINNIIARCSPVVIMQKVWRGYVIRKKMKMMRHSQKLLALESTITRGASSPTAVSGSVAPPPSTPFAEPDPDSMKSTTWSSFPGLIQIDEQKLHKIMMLINSSKSDDEGKTFHLSYKNKAKIRSRFTAPSAMISPHRKRPLRNAFTAKQLMSIDPFFRETQKDDLFVAYRVPTMRCYIPKKLPLAIVQAERREIGQEVRDIHQEIHDKKEKLKQKYRQEAEANRLRMYQELSDKSCARQRRAFNKLHATSSIACLTAVDKAYLDKEKRDVLSRKITEVRCKSNNYIDGLRQQDITKEQKRLEAINLKHIDSLSVKATLDCRENSRKKYADRVTDRKRTTKDLHLRSRERVAFAKNFTRQAASVSHALKAHDYKVCKESKLIQNQAVVQMLRENDADQQAMISDYLEQRRMLRQAEIRSSRTAIKDHISKEASARKVEGVARVQQLRELSNKIKEELKAYEVSETRLCTDLDEIQQRWDTMVLATKGRVGQHNVVY